MVLEVQEGDVSQETATANDKYLVSKTRLRMKQECVGDDVLRKELQQFDDWSFGRKLAHSRHLQAIDRGLSARTRTQDGVPDPFQDLHQDPWHGEPHAPKDDAGKEEKKPWNKGVRKAPEEPKKVGPGTLPPGLEMLRPGYMKVDSSPRPKKGKLSRIKKSKKKTFMMSCRGHLEEMIRRLDEEYNKVHGNTEGESIDEGSTAEVDRGSDDEGRSNDSSVTDKVTQEGSAAQSEE